MRVNLKINILILVSAVLLVVLAWIAFQAKCSGGRQLFLCIPKFSQSKDIKALDNLSQDNQKLMLTYQNLYKKNVKAENSRFDVLVYGTNYIYQFVMGYNIVNGGFFSQTQQKQKNKVAVLNEKAAFDMFGSINVAGNRLIIDGSAYLVSGVVRDNDRQRNVYVPAICLATSVRDIMCTLGGVSEEYVTGELAYYGIDQPGYDFVNLDLLRSVIVEKFYAALKIYATVILLCILIKGIFLLMSEYFKIKKMIRNYYYKDLIRKFELRKIILGGLFSGVGFFLIPALVKNIFEMFLKWGGFSLDNSVISAKLVYLKSLYFYSNVVFWVFVSCCTVFIILKKAIINKRF